MPAKKSSAKKTAQKLLPKISLKNVKFPHVKIQAPKSYTPVLMVLLIVAAFLIGVLVTKVQYLEQNSGSGALQAGAQQPAAGQQAAPTPGARVTVSNGPFPILGNKDAKVHIVEFLDPRCPFCEQFFTNTEPQLIKDYVDTGKVSFAVRLYTFLGPASTVASNALECANEQGKFWALHDYLYKNQPPETDTSMFTVDNLTNIAGTLGMNTSQFQSCLSANKYNNDVTSELAAGQKAGVTGTPTLFINGIPVVGAQPYSAFQTVIDQELAKAK